MLANRLHCCEISIFVVSYVMIRRVRPRTVRLQSNANRRPTPCAPSHRSFGLLYVESSKQPLVDEHPDKSTEEASDAGVIQDQAASFADGNIDIIAGNTSFRVHRGVLSVHSEVFRLC